MEGRLYFDGGVRPNPVGGFCSYYGWAAELNGQEVASGSAVECGERSYAGSCAAEFGALLHALTAAREHFVGVNQVVVMGDSRSVIELCSGETSPHAVWVHAILAAIRNAIGLYATPLSFQWIPREFNRTADRLGREAFAIASGQRERIVLMNKVNIVSRRKFGDFYDKDLMSEWSSKVTGKRKLSCMSIAELSLMASRAREIPEFIRDHVVRCNTAAQSVSA